MMGLQAAGRVRRLARFSYTGDKQRKSRKICASADTLFPHMNSVDEFDVRWYVRPPCNDAWRQFK